MKTYVGGQIMEECRGKEGNLAVVINHSQNSPKEFGVFIPLVGSEEFIYLTGMMAVNNPVDRVYLGLSMDAAVSIARESDNLRSGKIDLAGIDKKVVHSYFLNQERYEVASP